MPNILARTFTLRGRNEGLQPPDGPAFADLPIGARVLIAGTTAGALLRLLYTLPSARFDTPYTFLGLLLASVALATAS